MRFSQPLLIFILFLSLISVSQHTFSACECEYVTYYQQTSQAEILLIENKYEESYQLYLSALKDFEGFQKDYMNAAMLAAKLQDTAQVIPFLKAAIKKGQAFKFIQKMDLFFPYHSLPAWSKLIEEAKQLEKEAIIMPGLLSELEKIHKKDQRVRSFPFTLRWKKDWLFRKMWDRVDSTNYYRVKEMILEHGFPGEKVVGDSPKIFYTGVYIMVHSYYMDQDSSFGHTLFQEMCKGNLHAKHYGWIIDRRKRINEETEMYGTFFTRELYGRADDFAEFPPPFNQWDQEKIIAINQQRTSIGLSSVEDGAKWRNLMATGFYFYF